MHVISARTRLWVVTLLLVCNLKQMPIDSAVVFTIQFTGFSVIVPVIWLHTMNTLAVWPVHIFALRNCMYLVYSLTITKGLSCSWCSVANFTGHDGHLTAAGEVISDHGRDSLNKEYVAIRKLYVKQVGQHVTGEIWPNHKPENKYISNFFILMAPQGITLYS
jgi:hypothetical protein